MQRRYDLEAALTAVSLEHFAIFHHFEKVRFPANLYTSCGVKFYTPIICKSVLNSLPLRDVNPIRIGRMKYSEIERKLKKSGCYWVYDGKMHPIWYSPITGKEFPLSHHKSEEAKFGTMKSISKDSGVKL